MKTHRSDLRRSLWGRAATVLRKVSSETSENPIIISCWRSILLQPFPFFLWFRLRWRWYRLRGVPLQIISSEAAGSDHVNKHVIPHNLRKSRGYDRKRTERLINVLRSIHDIDLSRVRVLNIGPRNEMELLLLRLYGFKPENISAVDLFSYSPHVRVMDMHSLEFDDDTFDVAYCAYTLRYSDRLQRACDEILRCTRSGGLVAASFVTEGDGHSATLDGIQRKPIVGSPLAGGVDDLLARFGKARGDVYWREEYQIPGPGGPEKHCSTIFKVVKEA